MTKLCFRQINLICETDLSEAERPFGRLLLQSQQEEISTWIRAAAMGTEEGTDVRGNRKAELTTNRLLGSRGGREREAKTTGRFWAWVAGRAVKLLTKIGYTGGGAERKMLSSVLHTLKCGGAFFFPTCNISQLFIRKLHEKGEWASRPGAGIASLLRTRSRPKSFPECWFYRQTLLVLYIENIFRKKNILL